MTTTTLDSAVLRYVQSCEPYIADLDEAVRDQLSRDIAEIVTEVCAELEGDPPDLVGPPSRFVADLRHAAGLPPCPRSEDGSPAPPKTRRLRALAATVLRHRAVLWVRALMPELRPAWWVARGVLLAWFVGRLTGARGPSWVLNVVPHWPIFGSTVVGLAGVAAAVYVSVEVGRRRPRGFARVALFGASVVALAFAATVASDASRWTHGPAAYASIAGVGAPMHEPMFGAPMGGSMMEDTHSSGFVPVAIGSEATGEEFEVIDLATAQATVDRLLEDAPPAAVYIHYDGARHRPGTGAAIDSVLETLVANGYLNP